EPELNTARRAQAIFAISDSGSTLLPPCATHFCTPIVLITVKKRIPITKPHQGEGRMVRQLLRVLWVVGVVVLSPVWLFATVTRIEITTREPYLEGRAFDGVGSYERLRGKVFFAVDPKHAANQAV